MQVAFQRAAQEKRYKLSKDLAKLNKRARKTIRSGGPLRLWSKSNQSG